MANTDDYVNLITGEHQDKPKFVATIQALAAGFADTKAVLTNLPTMLDIDSATGDQLDMIGQWVGVTRYLNTPLVGVYFTWDDTVLTGWDSGTWKSPFDPDVGITTLPDDAYRSLLKARTVANAWDGTIPTAEAIWTAAFGSGQYVIIQDNQDMSMVIGFVGAPLTAVQRALLTGGYIPLKPVGVHVNYYAVPVSTGPIFAWDAVSTTLAGWESGSWAQLI